MSAGHSSSIGNTIINSSNIVRGINSSSMAQQMQEPTYFWPDNNQTTATMILNCMRQAAVSMHPLLLDQTCAVAPCWCLAKALQQRTGFGRLVVTRSAGAGNGADMHTAFNPELAHQLIKQFCCMAVVLHAGICHCGGLKRLQADIHRHQQ